MVANTVDEYLAELEEPKRATLTAMRDLLLSIEPGLEQTIGWGAPIFKFNGKNVAGLCAFKNHLVYAPQSNTVMESLASDLAEFKTSKASFQFGVAEPLDRSLVEKLLKARMAEVS